MTLAAEAREAATKAKKALKKKKPSRRENQTYWGEAQFKQLQTAPPGRLYSKGHLPWRLLAYLLKVSPEVSKIPSIIRETISKTSSNEDAPRASPIYTV